MPKLQLANPTDITLVGGGIMGLLIAREFALVGASVTVIDQGQTGREASWAGGGILLPLYPWYQDSAISRLVMASIKLYPQLVKQLHQTTNIDSEWNQCGLFISNNSDLVLAMDWCKYYQVRYSQTPPATVAAMQSQQNNPLWLPEIAQIRNPRLLKALKQYLLDLGVIFMENTQLQKLKIKQQQVQSVITTTGKIIVKRLILTTGAWTGDICSSLLQRQDNIPQIQPIKGQMLLFNAKPGLLKHIILAGECYLIPRADGGIVVGSTVEYCAYDKQTTAKARSELQAFALRLLPELREFTITHHWSGLRPGTPRGIPYIGLHPVINNLSICAGHYRNGLAMGPASARLLFDLLCKRPSLVTPEPYCLHAKH